MTAERFTDADGEFVESDFELGDLCSGERAVVLEEDEGGDANN